MNELNIGRKEAFQVEPHELRGLKTTGGDSKPLLLTVINRYVQLYTVIWSAWPVRFSHNKCLFTRQPQDLRVLTTTSYEIFQIIELIRYSLQVGFPMLRK